MPKAKNSPPTLEAVRRDLKGSVNYRAFSFREDEKTVIDEEARTVEVAFASEEPVLRSFGYEVLDLGPTGMDLTRLRSGASVLVNHDPDQLVGVVEDVRVDSDRRGRARLRFGRSAKATEVFDDHKDGIRQHISFGYEITDVVEHGERDGVPAYLVRTRPFEISTVAVPADATIGVGRSFDPGVFIHRQSAENIEEQEMSEKIESAAPASAVDVQAVEGKARDAERKRASAISAMGAKFGQVELARQFMDNGKSVEDFQAAVLERMGAKEITTTPDLGLDAERKAGRDFSMVRLLRHLSNPGDKRAAAEAGFELEICATAAKAYGKDAQGVFVPHEALKRDLTVGGTTTGSKLVGTDHLAESFIELLRNRMVMNAAGARTLDGLQGNIAIPRQSGGATAYWVSEGNPVTESNQTFDQVTLSPKTVGTFTDISRKLLIQSAPAVENLVRMDLAAVLARALDYAGIAGNPAVTATANSPRGIIYTSGIGSAAGGTNGSAPNWADIVKLETEVAVDNADMGSLAYIMNAKTVGKLKTTKLDTGSGLFTIGQEARTVNGYPFYVSNQVPGNLIKGSLSAGSAIIFGNFADAFYGLWSGLDLLVDPYTGGTAGTVRIIALQDADFAVRHPESFAAKLDANTV